MTARTCVRLVFLAVLAAAHVSAIRFYLKPGERRCFTDELPSNSRISGETLVSSGRGEMDIDVWITTMSGAVLYHKRSREHGKFSFRTSGASRRHDDEMLDDEDEYDYQEESTEEDTYKICLEHQQAPSRAHATGTKRMISFRLNEAYDGVAGKEGDAAEKGDTDRLQATMRDMHSSLSGMIGDLNQLQRREKGLTNRMKKMAKRVTALAFFSLVVTLATSAMQFRYYQGYFKQKKLC